MTYVPPAPPPGGSPQWGPPPGTGAYTPPRTEGTAVAALVCAIAAWLPVCPMILAIVALALAHAAGNKIDASGGRLTGDGLVKAAQIIAWIHIALFTIVLVIIAIALVAND